MYSPRSAHSTYAGMSSAERQFNDFIMNPLNWIGLGLVRAGVARLATSRAGGLWRASGRIKRPLNTLYAEGFGFRQPSIMAQRILSARKKGNVLLLGYSALNPLENVHYARKRDWESLIVNYHFPIIGVPIYNRLTGGIGAPTRRDPIRTTQPAKRGMDSWRSTQAKKRRKRYTKPPYSGKGSSGYGKPSSYSRQYESKRSRSWVPRKGKKCPPGYYWNWKERKCLKLYKPKIRKTVAPGRGNMRWSWDGYRR